MSTFLPAFLSCFTWSSTVAFSCKIYFYILRSFHYNTLFILVEVGEMYSVNIVQFYLDSVVKTTTVAVADSVEGSKI